MRRVTDFPSPRYLRGVTLVEMIVAIVVTGILVSIVSMFTRNQITSYFDVANRSELADTADTALRRMARELQGALPNSVRVSGTFMELVPIKDAGRYRAQTGGGGSDDPLDFISNNDSFDVFGPPVTVQAGDQLVVYNLGIPGSDVYSGSTRRSLSGTGSLSKLTISGAPFPLASPQNRFQIVGGPVSYVCDLASGTLWRYSGYAFQSAQPVLLATLNGLTGVIPARLATNVSACAFSYASGVLQRNGLVSISITLTGNGESVTLLHQVDLVNTP